MYIYIYQPIYHCIYPWCHITTTISYIPKTLFMIYSWKPDFFTIHHPSLGLSENRMPDFAPCWSAIFWGIPMIPTWLPIYHQFFIPILVSSIPIAIAPGWQISSIPIAINPLYHIIYPHSSLIRITDWLLQSDSIPFGKKHGLVVKGFHWIYPLFH